jgi:hypothetical protein
MADVAVVESGGGAAEVGRGMPAARLADSRRRCRSAAFLNYAARGSICSPGSLWGPWFLGSGGTPGDKEPGFLGSRGRPESLGLLFLSSTTCMRTADYGCRPRGPHGAQGRGVLCMSRRSSWLLWSSRFVLWLAGLPGCGSFARWPETMARRPLVSSPPVRAPGSGRPSAQVPGGHVDGQSRGTMAVIPCLKPSVETAAARWHARQP